MQGSKHRTARKGQPESDRQNKTARTELPVQDCQHRAAEIRQPHKTKREDSRIDSQIRTQNIQDRASCQETQNRTTSTALSGQYCLDRTFRAGHKIAGT